MPRKGYRKPETLTRRIKSAFTHAEALAIAADAAACGMTQAKYVRSLVLAGRGAGEMPRRTRKRDAGKLADEVHTLAMQVKKLGTNVNQLAKQANSGMVPIARGEVQYVLNQHQLLISAAIAYLEKAGA